MADTKWERVRTQEGDIFWRNSKTGQLVIRPPEDVDEHKAAKLIESTDAAHLQSAESARQHEGTESGGGK